MRVYCTHAPRRSRPSRFLRHCSVSIATLVAPLISRTPRAPQGLLSIWQRRRGRIRHRAMSPKRSSPSRASAPPSDKNIDSTEIHKPIWDTADSTLVLHLENLFEWLPSAHSQFSDLVKHRKHISNRISISQKRFDTTRTGSTVSKQTH